MEPGDLAHLIDDVVECLDLSAIEAIYEAELRGAPPYHPPMMTKLWLYAYAVGVTSSRRLAKLVQRDVGVMMLAAGNRPDFRTLNTFRQRHLKDLAGLFKQVLKLCRRKGLLELKHVAIDGRRAAIVDPLQQRLFPTVRLLSCRMLELLLLVLRGFLLGFRSRRDLVLENFVLRPQLGFASVPIPLRDSAGVTESYGSGSIASGQPRGDTFSSSARKPCFVGTAKGWRLYWTWKSRGRIGRPRLAAEVKDLIAQISRDNRPWGTERTRGKLFAVPLHRDLSSAVSTTSTSE